MIPTDVYDIFLGIWRRALNATSLDELTPNLIGDWAREKALTVLQVEERDVGAFAKTKAVVLNVEGFTACFPKTPVSGDASWQIRRRAADECAELWEKMEWFSPLWIPMGVVGKILSDARGRSKERAIELFNYHTSTAYTVPFQAVCIAQIMPQSRSLQEFCPIAREAFLAFFSGYRASSIAALIPAIEGTLTRIVSGAGTDLPISEKIDRAIDRSIATAARLHFEGMWTPREFLTTDYLLGQDERVFALTLPLPINPG